MFDTIQNNRWEDRAINLLDDHTTCIKIKKFKEQKNIIVTIAVNKFKKLSSNPKILTTCLSSYQKLITNIQGL